MYAAYPVGSVRGAQHGKMLPQGAWRDTAFDLFWTPQKRGTVTSPAMTRSLLKNGSMAHMEYRDGSERAEWRYILDLPASITIVGLTGAKTGAKVLARLLSSTG